MGSRGTWELSGTFDGRGACWEDTGCCLKRSQVEESAGCAGMWAGRGAIGKI